MGDRLSDEQEQRIREFLGLDAKYDKDRTVSVVPLRAAMAEIDRLRAALADQQDTTPERRQWVRLKRDDEDGGWVASFAPLPGAISDGATIPEALRNLAEALEGIGVVAAAEILAAPPPGVDTSTEEDEPRPERILLKVDLYDAEAGPYDVIEWNDRFPVILSADEETRIQLPDDLWEPAAQPAEEEATEGPYFYGAMSIGSEEETTEPAEHPKVVDLMQALEDSINAAKEARRRAADPKGEER